MKALFILFTIFLSVGAFAQQGGNLVFFSEEGEKFWVVLNGVRQNEEAQTNVKVTGLTAPGYKLKVIFEDKSLGEIDKNIPVVAGSEVTLNVRKSSKGEYVVRYLSEAPIAQAPKPAPEQKAVAYTAEPVVSQQVTVTEHTTTTHPGMTENVNVSIGVNAGSSGGAVDIRYSDGMPATTTTVATTTASTSAPAPAQSRPVYNLPGYNGSYGCDYPMGRDEFSSAKGSITSKSFEDSKLEIARQITRSKCLLASQVLEIMGLFTYEESKLDFAKYAYDYTYDIDNYYKVNDAFTYESSIEELSNYLESR